MITYLNLHNNVAELPARLVELRPSSISQTHEGIVSDQVENEAFQSQLLYCQGSPPTSIISSSSSLLTICHPFSESFNSLSILKSHSNWVTRSSYHQALRNQLSCLQNSHALWTCCFYVMIKVKQRGTAQCSSIKSNFVWPSKIQGNPLMLCTPQRKEQTMPKCPSNKYRLYSQVWTCSVGGNLTARIIQRARLSTVWSFWIIIHS